MSRPHVVTSSELQSLRDLELMTKATVEGLRQGLHRSERRNGHRVDDCLGTTGDDDVGEPGLKVVVRVRNGLGAGSTG